MKDLKIEPMKLIVSIVERGQGRNMIELFNGQRLTHHLQCAGKGTATSEIRDLLGLDGVEKDVIFTVGRGTMVNRVMRDLNNELRGAARSRGIVFDMKLTAMAHVTALAIQMNVQNEVGETARKAGARGGTIIHARWAGSESVEEFYGITVQQEKEVIAIVSSAAKRKDIMEAINRNHGMKTEARGTVCSLAIEDIVRLG